MSSILSTQKRQTFLRRKYCFFCVATALSPPVGLWPALPGLPLDSVMSISSLLRCRRFAHHLLRNGRLRRHSRSRGGFAMRPLVAVAFALLQALHGLVDAHRQELDHQVRYAQAPLEFLHGLGRRIELEQHVCTFPVLVHAIRQPAFAPLIHFVDRAASAGDHRFHLFDELVDLLFRGIRLHDKQLFVDPHSSSVVKPWARRLNIVMDFSTPSAIMEATASAPRPTSSSDSIHCVRLMGASRYSAPSRSL